MSFESLLQDIRAEFPDFRMVNKGDSTLMRLIGLALWVLTIGQMKDFMTDFITVIGSTVYVPDGWMTRSSEQDRIVILRHERVHMRQRRRYTLPLFAFLYLFFPLPMGLSYFRARFEWEAYEETLRAVHELRGPELLKKEAFKENMISHFTTAQYAWMWPFRSSVEKWYDEAVQKILSSS